MISKGLAALMVVLSFGLASAASAQTPGARADSAATSSTVPATPPPQTAVVSTPPDFPRLKISGLMFGDLYYNVEGNPNHVYGPGGIDTGKPNIDANSPITQDLNGYQIRRIYLQLDDDLSIKVSTRVRLEADGKSLTADGKFTTFVKNGYVQLRQAFPRSDVFVGLTNTPTFENSEAFWQYRSIEKTIADFRGVASSSDAGLSLKGFVDGAHHIGYYGMMGNGTFQKPETNRDKRFYFSLPLQFQDLRVEPYVDYESFPGDSDITTYKIFAGYEAKRFAVGYEQLRRIAHRPSAAYVSPRGYSIFARGALRQGPPNPINAYVRFDHWSPDGNAADRVDSDLYIAGLDWVPVRDLHLEPNVEATQYHGKGTKVPPPYHDVQLRLTVYILFR